MRTALRLLPITLCLLLALASFSYAYNATGGIITTDGLYTVHTFLTNGSLDISGTIANASVLMVAGGGAAYGYADGGGGAGGLIYLNSNQTLTGNNAVVIGEGGGRCPYPSGNTCAAIYANGKNSTFNGFTAIGGGGGGIFQEAAKTGGSGGGGGRDGARFGAAGIAGQGNAGGDGTSDNCGGGGGGAGIYGSNCQGSTGGTGGYGINYTINGSTVCYAGGGGGGSRSAAPGIGTCGGANGATGGAPGLDATNGTGGGGGGGAYGGALPGSNGGSGIVIVRYLTYVAPQPANASIVWVSQTPANLTSTNVITSRLRISYNITNSTPTPYLSYKVNNSLSDISIFINGTGYGGYKTTTGTNVSEIFNFTLDDNEVLPGTYTLNYSLFKNTAHSSTSINSNNYISTEILNVSNQTPYNFYEFMANGTGTNNIASYYCNSSYAFGNAPGSNSNCALIGNIPNNQSYDHSHGTNSSHHYLPFSINTTSGTFGSTAVKITPQSFFIIRGAQTAGTAIYTIAPMARLSTTKLSTNSGNSFTNLTYSVDTHTHQFTADETIYYQAYANVSGALNNSSIFSQVFGLSNLPPTTPTVLTPTAGNNYGTINVSWLASQNLTPSTFYYNVSLLNPDLTFNKTLIANTSNLSYAWNSAGTPQANYIIRVMAIDNYSLSSFDDSQEFTVATFNITHILPADNVVLQGNATLITYSVNNLFTAANCSIMLDAVAYDNRIVNNGNVSYLANVAQGSHNIYITCTSADTLYTATSAARVFSMGFVSYAFIANLTSTPANVFATPQAIFYDKNGSLNVLYYTDEHHSHIQQTKGKDQRLLFRV
jgi:hypothetical protein